MHKMRSLLSMYHFFATSLINQKTHEHDCEIQFIILYHFFLKCVFAVDKYTYFIPQAPTLALTCSRKDVKQLVCFQILQNADNIFLLSDNSAVILFPKV